MKALLREARSALVDGRWADARKALDALGARPHDLRGIGMLLASAEAYRVPCEYFHAIDARIKSVNCGLCGCHL